MDRVEEKHSVLIPTEQLSSGNSEKNSGLEKDTSILVHPVKAQDSKSENEGGEAGGYASYAVGQIRLLLWADGVDQEGVTECVCRSCGGTRRLSTLCYAYVVRSRHVAPAR